MGSFVIFVLDALLFEFLYTQFAVMGQISRILVGVFGPEGQYWKG